MAYCTVQDVEDVLQVNQRFTEDTTVTKGAVEKLTQRYSDHVDDLTGSTWQSNRVTDEIHRIDEDTVYHVNAGVKIYMRNSNVKDFDASKNDELGVWDGNGFENWASTRTEGRGEDYYVDYNKGIIYIRKWFYTSREAVFQLTYRYGKDNPPGGVTQATANFVAAHLLLNEDGGYFVTDTGDGLQADMEARANNLREEAKRMLVPHRSIYAV